MKLPIMYLKRNFGIKLNKNKFNKKSEKEINVGKILGKEALDDMYKLLWDELLTNEKKLNKQNKLKQNKTEHAV